MSAGQSYPIDLTDTATIAERSAHKAVCALEEHHYSRAFYEADFGRFHLVPKMTKACPSGSRLLRHPPIRARHRWGVVLPA